MSEDKCKMLLNFLSEDKLRNYADYCQHEHDYTRNGDIAFPSHRHIKAAKIIGMDYKRMSKFNRKIFRQCCIDEAMGSADPDKLLDLLANYSHKLINGSDK